MNGTRVFECRVGFVEIQSVNNEMLSCREFTHIVFTDDDVVDEWNPNQVSDVVMRAVAWTSTSLSSVIPEVWLCAKA